MPSIPSLTPDRLSQRETEYLRFTECASTSKTRVWSVESRRHGSVLGIISWYGAWRQYTFRPHSGTIFNSGCLADIQAFLDDAMADWREKLAAERKRRRESEAVGG